MKSLVKSMMATILGFAVIMAVMKALDPYGGEILWITSPTGETTRELPFKTALRIIRKRGWHLTPVEPIKKRKPMSRWGALRIFITGDHEYAWL